MIQQVVLKDIAARIPPVAHSWCTVNYIARQTLKSNLGRLRQNIFESDALLLTPLRTLKRMRIFFILNVNQTLVAGVTVNIVCQQAQYLHLTCSCGSVVEHCVSSAKGCGFNSQETRILIKKYI